MTIEDRLRDAIQERTDDVHPTRGYEEVRSRAAFERRRRDRRRLAGGGAALAVAASLVAFVLVPALGGDDDQRLETGPSATQPTTPPTTEPEAPTMPPPDDAPFVWVADDASTPEEAAERFAVEYLRMVDPLVGTYDAEGSDFGWVAVRAFDRGPASEVQVGEAGGGRWGVIQATTSEILVSSPRPAGRVASPLEVSGRGRAYEGHIDVEVRDRSGAVIADGYVTACQDEEHCPFEGSFPFPSTTESGALVLSTSSADDGRLLVATVVPLHFGVSGVLPSAAAIAAWDAESMAIHLLDPTTGSVTHDLRHGGDGLRLAVGRDDVVWYARHEECGSTILRVAPGEQPVEVVRGWELALAPDGRRLAYTRPRAGECGGPFDVVIRDLATGDERVLAGADGGGTVEQLTWAESGLLAFEVWDEAHERPEVRWLDTTDPPRSLAEAATLVPPAGVSWRLPAFRASGSLVVLEEDGGSQRFVAVRPADGRRLGALVAPAGSVREVATGPGDAVVFLTDDNRIWTWDGGEARLLAEGYAAVGWWH
jgi:hypothetical protein